MDNFDNADKCSLSGRITAITFFEVQPGNHIRKPTKDSFDPTNIAILNKLLC